MKPVWTDAYTIQSYPSERMIELGWGSARYVKATEYRVIDRSTGGARSFWTAREARAYAATITGKIKED